ncbi:hypothetical protein KQX54_019633, partial [Cotesia glomerata]
FWELRVSENELTYTHECIHHAYTPRLARSFESHKSLWCVRIDRVPESLFQSGILILAIVSLFFSLYPKARRHGNGSHNPRQYCTTTTSTASTVKPEKEKEKEKEPTELRAESATTTT